MSDAPDPADLLDTDSLLSGEERAVRDRVRAFVDEHVAPVIEEWFEKGTFPVEIARGFGDLGVLGMQLEGYGCPGRSAVEYGLACMEIEAADSGLRSFVSVQGSLAMFAIHAFGSEQQKQEWLPKMARGEAIGCFALTEPDSGSDPSGMTTFARRDGDDWVLDGVKRWNTNGTVSDVTIVWAKTDDRIRGFVVPSNERGVVFSAIERSHSLRAAARSELTLDGCRLPSDAVLPAAEGLSGPLTCLNEARYGIAFGAMGAARTCFSTAVDYAKERMQFGRPIGGFQLTQRKLARMALGLNTGMLLALHLGRLKDAGRSRPEQISAGKLNNARAALEIAREARTILAANGVTMDYPVMRHMANLESVITYEGTEEIHELVIGAALTGLRAFD